VLGEFVYSCVPTQRRILINLKPVSGEHIICAVTRTLIGTVNGSSKSEEKVFVVTATSFPLKKGVIASGKLIPS